MSKKRRFREVDVDLKRLSDDSNELRSVIISSSMASCYVMLEEIASHRGLTVPYQDFRRRWIDLYKSVYDNVSQWKTRATVRLSVNLGDYVREATDAYEITGAEEIDRHIPDTYHQHHHE